MQSWNVLTHKRRHVKTVYIFVSPKIYILFPVLKINLTLSLSFKMYLIVFVLSKYKCKISKRHHSVMQKWARISDAVSMCQFLCDWNKIHFVNQKIDQAFCELNKNRHNLFKLFKFCIKMNSVKFDWSMLHNMHTCWCSKIR